MFFTFFKFFTSYIFKAKSRQSLLILALTGLVLSSLSLVVVQSALTGLQDNRIIRAKEIMGHYYIKNFKDESNILNILRDNNINFSRELTIEGLLSLGGHVHPVILHGISDDDFIPQFLDKRISKDEIVLPRLVANILRADFSDQIVFFSPSIVDPFFGDVPRQKSMYFSRLFSSNEPEIDEFHAWTNLRNMQSLLRKKMINTIRIYSPLSDKVMKELALYEYSLISWESENSSLVYALKLENGIMLFLFLATIILVTISIAGGLVIFYNRLKVDFASFWILGMSMNNIKKSGLVNISLITTLTVIIGNLFGVLIVLLLENFSPVIMPRQFVDRSLPVKLVFSSFIYSLIIPILITFIVSILSNKNYFSKKTDFLNLIRSAGR